MFKRRIYISGNDQSDTLEQRLVAFKKFEDYISKEEIGSELVSFSLYENECQTCKSLQRNGLGCGNCRGTGLQQGDSVYLAAINRISNCTEVIFLPDWHESKQCRIEYMISKALDKDIFFDNDADEAVKEQDLYELFSPSMVEMLSTAVKMLETANKNSQNFIEFAKRESELANRDSESVRELNIELHGQVENEKFWKVFFMSICIALTLITLFLAL